MPNIKVSTFCGGIPLRPHLASLVHEPHIVVGTPGRVQELMDNGALKLDALQTLVLDEADRMLDMGFEAAIAGIASQAPKTRQTLLFSATYPEEIRAISQRFQREPVIGQRGYRTRRRRHRAAVLRSGRAAQARRADATAGAAPAGVGGGVLQYQARCPGRRRPAGQSRHLGAGPARRPGAARSRRSPGALRQPQLRGAGGHRCRRARPGHQGPVGGDQLRTGQRCRHPHPSHRPHRARRAEGPGAGPGGAAGNRPRGQDRGRQLAPR